MLYTASSIDKVEHSCHCMACSGRNCTAHRQAPQDIHDMCQDAFQKKKQQNKLNYIYKIFWECCPCMQTNM
jgi:hypothetical protein